MRDLKTFKQWMGLYGLRWTEGQEQIVKGAAIDQTEAEQLIREFYNNGYLTEKEPTL